MSIMIVEDDYVLAKDLQSIVEAARHRSVGPLQRMEQALAYAATADIALVALKLADGPTRASMGRKLVDMFRLEVIYVTGAGRSESRPGSSEVIMKPLSEEQVSAAIARAALRHATRYDRIRQ